MLDNYETVAERLARWLELEHNGQPRVLTDMISQPGADVCVFRAELWIDQTIIATGWAEEIRGQGNVNRTSHVENCETSAIGRALANAGIAGSDPSRRASREEMQKVQRYNGPSQSSSNASSERTVRGPSESDRVVIRDVQAPASEKQIGYIKGACKRDGVVAPVWIDTIRKGTASNWIEKHKEGMAPADINKLFEPSEEPF
jgi:hypothetical protein